MFYCLAGTVWGHLNSRPITMSPIDLFCDHCCLHFTATPSTARNQPVYVHERAGTLVQWVKMTVWKVEDRGFELHSGLQLSKKQNVSSSLTREDLLLLGASMTERYRARPQTVRARFSNPVSGGQFNLIHLTILRSFSWHRLAHIYTIAQNPIHFISSA